MKIRTGFVSNSSSSSFVVNRIEDRWTTKSPKKLLTKEQGILLRKHGFRLADCYYPDNVDYPKKGEKLTSAQRKYANWVHYVSCNQDEVIEFLLKNRLGFTADIHYGHRTMIYDGKTDKLLIAQNFGQQALMNGTNKVDFKPYTPGVQYTTGAEYLKTHKFP
jgi:hypothetical protein